MAKDPAFLFYPEKFINGTLFMTDEQTGKYIKLLCHQHQNGGMISKEDFENFVGDDKKVRSKFVETNDGFFNERMMVEIEKRKKKSNNLSANAKKRWDEHKQKQCKSNAKAMPSKDTNTNKDINVIKDDNKKNKETKHKHGEYDHVLLTDSQLEKLVKDFGQSKTDAAIKFFDEWIEEKGTRNVKGGNHNLSMRRWVFNAVDERTPKTIKSIDDIQAELKRGKDDSQTN